MTKKLIRLIVLISIFIVWNNVSNNSQVFAKTTRTKFTQTYTLTKDIPASVDVSDEIGAVTVGYHKDHSIEVKANYSITGVSEAAAKEIVDNAKISAVQKNHSLRIRIVEKNSGDNIWDYISDKYRYIKNMRCSIKLQILLPDKVKDLSINTECGNINVNSLKINVNAVSEVGSIDISSLNGSINATSETGNITVESSQGDIKASTETGSVYLSSIQGNVDSSTETGSIFMDCLNGTIIAKDETGSIDARNMIFQGNSIIRTETGNINCSLQKGKVKTSLVKLLSDTGRIKIDVNKLTLAKVHGNNDYSVDQSNDDDDDEFTMKLLVNNKCNISAITDGDIVLIK